MLNAVRFFVAGYKIHFQFLCPQVKDDVEVVATASQGSEEAGPSEEETETSSVGGELEGNLMGSSISSESILSSPRAGPREQTDV